ncbi:glycoside hydrolase [Meredithblackwellia eburnea MCA 4105]
MVDGSLRRSFRDGDFALPSGQSAFLHCSDCGSALLELSRTLYAPALPPSSALLHHIFTISLLYFLKTEPPFFLSSQPWKLESRTPSSDDRTVLFQARYSGTKSLTFHPHNLSLSQLLHKLKAASSVPHSESSRGSCSHSSPILDPPSPCTMAYPPPRSPSLGRSQRVSSVPSRSSSYYPDDPSISNGDLSYPQRLPQYTDRRPSFTASERDSMLPPGSPRSPPMPGSPTFHQQTFSPSASPLLDSSPQFTSSPRFSPAPEYGFPAPSPSPSPQPRSEVAHDPQLNRSASSDPYSMYDGYQPSLGASTTTMNLSIADNESQRGMVTHRLSQLMDDGANDVYNEKEGHLSAKEKREQRRRDRAGITASSNPDGKGWWGRLSSKTKKIIFVVLAVVVVVVAAGIAVPFAIKGTKNSHSGSSTNGTSTASAKGPASTATTGWKKNAYGYDGSLVYADDGSTFIYNNSFGGFWNSIPFNDSARAQADVPALNQPWDYNTNLINGVNLGGWLVLEPFIVPAMYEPFNSPTNDPNATNGAIDEWTLSLALGSNLTAKMTEHYETFITEKDFAEIAGAGLNWVRLPIPYWIIETWEGEPMLANVGWTYFLKALEWARKYGLRVNIDLHAIPGSQNGYNHSSKFGTINWLNGVMGLANAQRSLNYIRTITEFITQPQYSNVVPMFSILNEPIGAAIGTDNLRAFYVEVYEMMRGITGFGTGKGPFIGFHDGFMAQGTPVAQGGWNGFLPGADRIAIDTHPYLVFTTPNADPMGTQATKPCQYWASAFNTSTNGFGLTIGGEWSLAVNDCGKWLNNVGNGQRFDGTFYALPNTAAPAYAAVGSCDTWNNWAGYSDDLKSGFEQLAYAHMDSLRHWFFWTWKTGYSNVLGTIGNPMWNYQLALQQGYMPKNPRLGQGSCPGILAAQNLQFNSNPASTLSSWQTGGAGAGTLQPSATAQVNSYAWPPTAIGLTPTSVSNFPTYTPTGSIISMQGATPTAYPNGYSSVVGPGSGWAQPTDTSGWYTPVAGCSYPNPWSGVGAAVPTAPCTGPGVKLHKRRPSPMVTAPPHQPQRH